MSNFYLGRLFDLATGKTTDQPLQYDADDLTTHGVIVGMTGSGKTGLCLDLMEEAALNDVPAIMIDPKGDITNALLHFPELAPADFAPWINAADAQRDGKTVDEVAAATSDLWRNGLFDWGIGPERMQELSDSAQFAIFTPGSDSGLPVSILSSLAAPPLEWNSNKEALRENIGSTVTALLGLVGRHDIDPVRDREHILLANIFEHAWSAGKDLTLGDLIMQVQNPPFEKLGFFDVATFFPDKARFQLAIELNNILAAPSFQSWINGSPLDIQAMLYTPEGKPRHTIFYIAHLNDEERMFFVTLLYSAIETWVRSQSGTSSLRALVYFDEIFGYLPPSANPPSKEPMLRLLKQARAFGVGMVLATQNPVDIDYKALSNAGTWFIGRLATERDKDRLLDGLESATGGGVSRSEYDRMISGMGKRVFLLRNVHEKAPVLFQTRWAMNYLAGPITRDRIGELNALAGAKAVTSGEGRVTSGASAAVTPSPAVANDAAPVDLAPVLPGTATRPKVPGRVAEYFLPQNVRLETALREARRIDPHAKQVGVIYHPILLAQADIRINNKKYDIDQDMLLTCLVESPDERGRVRWDEFTVDGNIDHRDLDRDAEPDAHFGDLERPLTESTAFTSMKKEFTDWAYRETEITLHAHEELGVYGDPGMSLADFKLKTRAAAQAKIAEETAAQATKFERTLESIQKKLRKEEMELEMDKEDLSSRKREEMVKHGETLLGMLGVLGRRRSVSGSMSKRRMTSKAKMDVQESEETIMQLERELRTLKSQQESALVELQSAWMSRAEQTTTIAIQPFKKDITLDLFGVAWLPHFVVDDDGRLTELPAFALA